MVSYSNPVNVFHITIAYSCSCAGLFDLSPLSDVDGVLRLVPVLSPELQRFSPDTTASSPSYPSSPGLSSPRPCPSDLIDLGADPALLRQHLQRLRAQVEEQHRTIQHLQQQLQKKSPSSELLSVTSDPTGGVDEDRKLMKAQITQLNAELEKERSLSRTSQSGSPSRYLLLTLMKRCVNMAWYWFYKLCLSLSRCRIESLVQSQARELCELREQIRVSRGLGVEQRKQLLELRGALEELFQPSDTHTDEGSQLRERLDRSLSLLEKLEQGKYTHGEECKTSDRKKTQQCLNGMMHTSFESMQYVHGITKLILISLLF